MAFALLKYISVQYVLLIILYHVTVFITWQAGSRGDYYMVKHERAT